jgi:hypothetical protein
LCQQRKSLKINRLVKYLAKISGQKLVNYCRAGKSCRARGA